MRHPGLPELLLLVTLASASAPGWLLAQAGPQFEFRLSGPCGETITGAPGSEYDDGTGGADHFFDPLVYQNEFREVPGMRPGHSRDVILLTTENPTVGSFDTFNCARDFCDIRRCDEEGVECIIDALTGELLTMTVPADVGAQGWAWSLGVEGAVSITDVTTHGTVSCRGGRFPRAPECLNMGGFEMIELTGPPRGRGPQTEANRGAVGAAVIGGPTAFSLPAEMESAAIAKIRLHATFPPNAGEEVTGRLVWELRTGSGQPVPNIVTFRGSTFSDASDPPLRLTDCELTFRAVEPVGVPFLRGDADGRGGIDVTDAVVIINWLFYGGPRPPCLEAADADDTGAVNITDVVYLFSWLFQGGGAPPPPGPRECAPDPAPESGLGCRERSEACEEA